MSAQQRRATSKKPKGGGRKRPAQSLPPRRQPRASRSQVVEPTTAEPTTTDNGANDEYVAATEVEVAEVVEPVVTPRRQRAPREATVEAPRSVLAERIEAIRRLFREIFVESRRVSWPDRETTRNLTVVVIGISIALGALLGGLDWVLFQVFEAMT